MKILKILGIRTGTEKYLYKDFLYHVDVNYRGRRYVCAQKTSKKYRCHVSLIVEGGVIEIRGNHNHPTATLHLKEPAIKMLKELATKQLLSSPHDIINTVREK